jgi:hypothetical protein
MGNRAETEDEALGFEAAVAALGLKANVSEADHPLLCEGTRRQRGELTLTLLVQYKDCSEKLARIMDKLLDRFSRLVAGFEMVSKPFFYFLQRGTSVDEGAAAAVVLLEQPAYHRSIPPPLTGQQNWPTVSGAMGAHHGGRSRRRGGC